MWNIKDVPHIKSERLCLDKIQEKDIDVYNRIVLDETRNLYWGYDDLGALGETFQRDSFYRITLEDFAEKEALNFAVRLPDGSMIGEAVFFNFQDEEVGELGCRIDSLHKGKGYGREAFGAAMNWALETGFLKKVVSKCFKENKASYKMLSAHMEPTGEDEIFFYFAKSAE